MKDLVTSVIFRIELVPGPLSYRHYTILIRLRWTGLTLSFMNLNLT